MRTRTASSTAHQSSTAFTTTRVEGRGHRFRPRIEAVMGDPDHRSVAIRVTPDGTSGLAIPTRPGGVPLRSPTRDPLVLPKADQRHHTEGEGTRSSHPAHASVSEQTQVQPGKTQNGET